ncbi:MAG: dihydroxy-acid dehydratase [Desulfarculus sp.]|nr:dihydroxy-acid dehydratase [Desulfarculus sp.]
MPSDTIKSGLMRAPQRSLLRATGLGAEDIKRPFIGVANSWTEVVPGHVHLDRLARAVKRGVREAGGQPFEFHTMAICDGLAMGHAGMHASLPSREVVADTVELMTLAHGFDALVLIASCDKIVPGMLMAAARLDRPAIMVTGGPMLAGDHHGQVVDLITVFEAVAKVKAGQMSPEELEELEGKACPGAGSCAGMFTANTMACVTEALGMSLPGCAAALAEEGDKDEIAYSSGLKIMELLSKGLRPSAILSARSLENACRVDLALGGSTNTALHLPAIAHAAGVDFGLKDFDRLARATPHLVCMSPAGPMRMQHLQRAGGVGAVMKRLEESLHLEALTVTGGPLASYLPSQVRDVEHQGQPVIRTLDDPVHAEGGIAVLMGNLAPQGAVVKQTAVAEGLLQHQGPARVFDSEEAAVEAVNQGLVRPGEVLVVRYEGPAGGPGMREMLALTSLISGGDLDGKVALVTDGRFSGGSRGAAIGHVSPEAAAGGPLALVRDGDPIAMDIPGRRLELLVDEGELARRRDAWRPPAPKFTRGPLARYAALVTSAASGAVLRDGCRDK